ncbi:nitrilase [Sphingorhabdus lutea]|uniref:Nitrilase n=1 Tax=Sphingorhabdus lutea TaxID=1913578 RepID=A0A1L3JD28_9SPHN|nr:carbon-nitrogen hydrolase family protein [Sphingorhabdus lutea]APG63036.1 nitrilase [Sphingorhabdus lutea]
MKIAVHQMCSTIDYEKNFEMMAAAIGRASANGAAAYFAPEMSILLDRDRVRSAPSIEKISEIAFIARFKLLAKKYAIWLHLGSFAQCISDEAGQNGKRANRSIIINADGEIIAQYDKIHLFDVDLSSGESWRESSIYRAGPRPVIAPSPLGDMGLSICYDVRFPDLYSHYAKSSISAIAVPAAFTVPTGQAHWHILLRARAIEAEAFVIAAAQCGNHQDGRQTYGHSLVIDPWGNILLDMGQGENGDIGYADIDMARIDDVRAQIPVHQNRRDI